MLIKKAVAVRKHLQTNRKDKDSKFRLILIESRSTFSLGCTNHGSVLVRGAQCMVSPTKSPPPCEFS